MKNGLRRTSRILVTLTVASALSMACKPARPRGDWRMPAGVATSCTSDGDCASGHCTIELGASRGQCAPVDGVDGEPGDGGAAGRDGGARPVPPPAVQPAPGDLHI